jgi:spore coat protein U-like protein
MKKLMATLLVAGAFGVATSDAANTSGQFNVNMTLASTCSLSAVTAIDFAYTSLQGGVANGTNGNFTVTCTNSLPYTFGLQTGTGAATPPGAATITVTDNAVNLQYVLGTSAAGATGNGASQAYNVTGTMAANQSGTCGVASCTNAAATNRTHTLILNY